MGKNHDTSKRAEMQCSDVNPGAVQKAKPHPRARDVILIIVILLI